MPVTNSDPLQHGIGLEKGNGANVALLPQPASEPRRANSAGSSSPSVAGSPLTKNGRAAVAARLAEPPRFSVLAGLVAPALSVIRRVGRSVIPAIIWPRIRGVAVGIGRVTVPPAVIPAVIGVSGPGAEGATERESAQPDADRRAGADPRLCGRRSRRERHRQRNRAGKSHAAAGLLADSGIGHCLPPSKTRALLGRSRAGARIYGENGGGGGTIPAARWARIPPRQLPPAVLHGWQEPLCQLNACPHGLCGRDEVNSRLFQRPQTFLRPVDDRLLMRIETGVDQDGQAGLRLETGQDVEIERVVGAADDLRSRCVVDMNHRWDSLPPALCGGTTDRHKTCGVAVDPTDIENLLCLSFADDRR